VCFERAGDEACDDAVYATKVLVFDDTPVDNRSCTGTCSCEPPEGGACTGTVTVEDGSCAGAAVGTLSLGQACAGFAGPVASSGITLTATVASPGVCTPNPRTEQGSLEGIAHTLCCAAGL